VDELGLECEDGEYDEHDEDDEDDDDKEEEKEEEKQEVEIDDDEYDVEDEEDEEEMLEHVHSEHCGCSTHVSDPMDVDHHSDDGDSRCSVASDDRSLANLRKRAQQPWHRTNDDLCYAERTRVRRDADKIPSTQARLHHQKRQRARKKTGTKLVRIPEHQKQLVGSRNAKRALVLQHMFIGSYRRLVRDPTLTLQGSKWFVDGQQVYHHSFLAITHCSDRFLQRLRRELVMNSFDMDRTRRRHRPRFADRSKERDPARKACLQFFDFYLLEQGTWLPHDDGSYSIVMSNHQKKAVFDDIFSPWFLKTFRGTERTVPSMSTFSSTLHAFYGHVKFTNKQRFTHCSTCALLMRKIDDSVGDAAQKKLWLDLRDAHLEEVRDQRYSALFWEELARAMPDQYLWTCNDAMDSTQTMFPRSGPRLSGGEHALKRIKMSVLNFLNSYRPHNVHFCRPETVPSTTNAHTWCEWRMLQSLMAQYEKDGVPWPHTWIIYEDNTTHDNKNNFRMWWLSLLVELGVFKTIIVCCFDVGHTHWRNDQKFSILSSVLSARSKGPFTIDDLAHDLKFNGTEDDRDSPPTEKRRKEYNVLEAAEDWGDDPTVTRPWREIRAHVHRQIKEREEQKKAAREAAGGVPRGEPWLVEAEKEEEEQIEVAAAQLAEYPFGAKDEDEWEMREMKPRARNARVRWPNEVHIVYHAWDLNKWCMELRRQCGRRGVLPKIENITQFQRFQMTRDTSASHPRVQVALSQSPLSEWDTNECKRETYRS